MKENEIRKEEVKLFFFTGEMILYLENPKESLRKQLIKKFSK